VTSKLQRLVERAAHILGVEGREAETLAIAREAVAISPGDAGAQALLACAYLYSGDHAAGWRHWKLANDFANDINGNEIGWDGQDDIAGRTLLVRCDPPPFGLGDWIFWRHSQKFLRVRI